MKICVISFHSCPFSIIGDDGNGGMSVYLRELSSALARNGAKIDVFTRRRSSDIPEITRPAPGMRVVHITAGPVKTLNRASLQKHLPEFQTLMGEFIERESSGYHLLYTHYWLSGHVGIFLKSRFGLPLVHTYHTLGFLKQKALLEGEYAVRLREERILADRSDRIIVSSPTEKEALMDEYALFPEKIRIVSPGVDPDLFTPGLEKPVLSPEGSRSRLRLLYVGRIEPVKGLMTLVQALGRLRRTQRELFERIELRVAGGGKSRSDIDSNSEIIAIRREISRLGLEETVHFLGSIPQRELARMYVSAHALVVPSLYESFGLVVVEALACGTPVLVSGVGWMRSLIREGETGLSFRPDDPAALADCIRRFDRDRRGFAGPDEIRGSVVPGYCWKRAASESLRIFRSLVRRSPVLTTRPESGENPPPV